MLILGEISQRKPKIVDKKKKLIFLSKSQWSISAEMHEKNYFYNFKKEC